MNMYKSSTWVLRSGLVLVYLFTARRSWRRLLVFMIRVNLVEDFFPLVEFTSIRYHNYYHAINSPHSTVYDKEPEFSM